MPVVWVWMPSPSTLPRFGARPNSYTAPSLLRNQYPDADAVDGTLRGFVGRLQYPAGNTGPPLGGAPMWCEFFLNVGHDAVPPARVSGKEPTTVSWPGVLNPATIRLRVAPTSAIVDAVSN